MDNDILQNPELKKNPYSIPEGYFDKLKRQAQGYAKPRYAEISIWGRLAPYGAIAAMFLFVLILGKTFIQPEHESVTSVTETETFEDYLVFSDLTSDISMQYIAEENNEIDLLSEDDIIEYLIYIGATEEYIEYSNK